MSSAIDNRAGTTIAAVAAPFGRDLDRCLFDIARLLAAARRLGAHIVVLPEAALGGYLTDLSGGRPGTTPDLPPALDVDGRVVRQVATMAGSDLVVCVGMCESDGDRRYNTAVCVHDGAVLGVHRKVHLPLREDASYDAGDRFEAFDTPAGRLGMLVCYDKAFPEASRRLALDGATVVACLSAWPASRTAPAPRLEDDRWTRRFDLLDQAGALQHQVVWASANQSGTFGDLRFVASAKVVAPGGEVLASTGTTAGLAVATVDIPETLRATRAGMGHLRDRRPDAYGDLAAPRFVDPDDATPTGAPIGAVELMASTHVAVIGGSVAGLSAALFLARRGHRVTVLERDPSPTPPTAEEAGMWRRRGTPQAAHSHAFLARSQAILAAEAPDVLDRLAAAGVRRAELAGCPPPTLEGFAPEAGDDELVVLNARRSTFEWVLRRTVEDEPGVDLRVGVAVTGLATEANGAVRATGVLTDGGLVAADVVVDAGGKRSPVRGWITGAGEAAPGARDVPCGISYLTRFYRLRDGEPGPLNRGFTHGASFDRYSCLVFPGDQGAFSVTFGVLPEDRSMRALLDPEAFDAGARSIPSIAPWVQPEASAATSDVALMAGLHNLLRSLDHDGPLGLHAIGDAHCITNPAHTRGTTLALLAAQRLAAAIDDHPTDPHSQREALGAFTAGELTQWVEDSVAQDAARLARWRPDVEPDQPLVTQPVTNGDAYLAAQRDPASWRAFGRLQNTLALPDEVLGSAALAGAVERVKASGWRPPPVEAPDHDELVALAGSATGR